MPQSFLEGTEVGLQGARHVCNTHGHGMLLTWARCMCVTHLGNGMCSTHLGMGHVCNTPGHSACITYLDTVHVSHQHDPCLRPHLI